jgi:hypothetical protein
MRHEKTTTYFATRTATVAALASLAIGVAMLAVPREASAQSTPLGNAAFGTATSTGGANGVQSPSGPGIHPGYNMVSFRNAIGLHWRFGGMDWLSDGRMVAVMWGNDVSYQTGAANGHQENGIYGDVGLDVPNGGGPGWMNLIANVQGAGGITPADTTRIYTGLWEPLGLFVGRSGNPATDTIYVFTKTGLLRFIGTGPYTNGVNPIKVVKTCANRTCAAADSAGPGIYRAFTTHAPTNYGTMSGRRWHHFNFGLVRGNDGYLYGGTGVQYDGGNDRYEQGRDRCAVLKMNPTAGTVEVVAGGLRSPNGFAKGPEGEIFFPDIQGNYNPANSINNYRPGRYYGFRCDTEQPFGHTRGIQESFPVVDLNQGTAATAIGANPGGMVYLTSGPYAGQMLIGDVTFGGIQRVFLEKIQGEWQGAIMLFSGGFRSGIGRLLLGPDGSIYAGGQTGGTVQSSGNWCWGGATPAVGALTADRGTGAGNTNCNVQRDFFKLVPKDTTVFEVLAVRARAGGFELQFTKKVGPSAGVPTNYTVRTWTNNLSSQTYGGGALQGNTLVTVNSVRIHPDSMRVFLELATMPAASVRPAVPAATAPTGNAPANGGNVRVVNIKATGVLAADGSTPWGEPVTAGAAPSRLAVWYTLNFHSTDTAFAPVALVDKQLAAPENRARDFRVRYAGGALLLRANFSQPVRFIVRDLRGRSLASRNVAPGAQDVSLSVAHLARGSYVVEARVAGQIFARPVALY